MSVLLPMRPHLSWVYRLIFIASRALPDPLAGLMGMYIIHLARWFIIKRDQWPDVGQGAESLNNDCMKFCSNFNGTRDQHDDAFSDGLPNGLDLFWYSSTRYPGSIPVTPRSSWRWARARWMARAAGGFFSNRKLHQHVPDFERWVA